MANLPPMKLSPEATPWGREIERLVTALDRKGGLADTNAAATQQQMGSAAAALAEANAIRAAAARIPNAPTNLVVLQSGTWDSNGAAKVNVSATWTKTSTGIDGDAIQITGYEIWWQPAGITAAPVLLSAVQPNEFTRDGFTPQVGVVFKVRAITRDNVYSQFSDLVVIDLVAPMTPLPTPSTPVLAADRGVITVKWDGKLGNSALLPQRFAYLYVSTSATENGLYTPVGQTLASTGIVVVTTVPYGSTAWFKLVAVDKLGITSASSAAVSILSSGINLGTLGTDVTAAIAAAKAAGDAAQTTADGKNKVTYATTAPSVTGRTEGDIWYKTDAGYAQYSLVSGAWVLNPLGSGSLATGAVIADKLAANSVAAVNLQAGSVVAGKLAADSVVAANILAGSITVGKLAVGALDAYLITGANIQTDAAANRGLVLNSTGLKAYDAFGVATVSIASSTGAVTMNGLQATAANISGIIHATGGDFSGSLTLAGTLTGGILQTAASGRRVKINGESVKFYSPSDISTQLYAADDGQGGGRIILDYGQGSVEVGKSYRPYGGVADMFTNSAWIKDLTVNSIRNEDGSYYGGTRYSDYGDTTTQDANMMTKTGFYRNYTVLNSPSTDGWWWFAVQAHDPDWIVQDATGYASSFGGQRWRRTRMSGVWGPWSIIQDVKLSGSSMGLTGNYMPAGAQIIMQAGRCNVGTNANGDGAFLYPTAFPNGVLSVQLTRFNTAVGDTSYVLNTTQGNDVCTLRVYQSNGAVLPNYTTEYMFTAIGW